MGRTRFLGSISFLACGLLAVALVAQDAKERIRARMGGAQAQAERPSPGGGIGLAFKARAAEGDTPACIEILQVTPGSPAEKAGIQVGDLVLSVDGKPIPSANLFMAVLQGPGIANLELRRAGKSLQVPLVLPEADSDPRAVLRRSLVREAMAKAGARAGTQAASQNPFTVPGQAKGERSRGAINTLRTVFIDPRTGAVTFLGTYDPAFDTGPIDYATLLGDALRSPYPSFSLDPSSATQASRTQLLAKVDADMSRVQRDFAYGKSWLLRIGNMLASDSSLPIDRQRFLKRGAEAMGTTPSQALSFWNVVAEKTTAQSPEWFEVIGKVFERLGTPEISRAIEAMRNPDTVRTGFEILGLGTQLNDLKQQVDRGSLDRNLASAKLQVLFWGQIMSRLKVPESSWKAAGDRVAAGQAPLDPYLVIAQNHLSAAITDRIMTPWLNGLVLSQAFLERFYQVPPVEVVPTYLGGLTADSELAKSFFAADWVLKMMAISPELSEKVPGHLTYQNYEFRLASARGEYGSGSQGSIRAWLSPSGVELQHDPAGSVVSFGKSRIAIRSELTTFSGGSRAASALEQEATTGYAREVTQRYDEYARALPDLHRLREAAKLIALVRWARQQGRNLQAPEAAAPGKPLPPSFRQGFWTATLLADTNKVLFVISAHGGVAFDQKQGEAWVQPQAAPGLASSALKQLVGSAALGQQAAKAALEGDLEGARDLAQKSEQAMIGDLRSGFPPLAQIPDVPEPSAYAAFQSQALAQSREAIEGLRQANAVIKQAPDGTQREQAEAQRQKCQQQLQALRDLMAQGQGEPASAPRLLVQLKSGPMGSTVIVPAGTSAATPQPAPAPVTLPKPPPEPAAAPGPPPMEPSPTEPPIEKARLARKIVELAPAERARVLAEIAQLRSELCRIQTHLRKFNATIQADQDQRAQWEKITNDTYQGALAKAKEMVLSELKDLSLEWPKGHLDKKLAQAATPAERERIQRSLRLVQHLKESYDLKDFAAWAAHENYSRKEILEGLKMVSELIGLDEYIKEKFLKRWGIDRLMAFKNAAQDVIDSAYDVTAEVLAWRRLNQLNRNSDDFLKAVDATSRRLKNVMDGIRERELKLGMPEGSSKGECP